MSERRPAERTITMRGCIGRPLLAAVLLLTMSPRLLAEVATVGASSES
jgi:hypothetical protein